MRRKEASAREARGTVTGASGASRDDATAQHQEYWTRGRRLRLFLRGGRMAQHLLHLLFKYEHLAEQKGSGAKSARAAGRSEAWPAGGGPGEDAT